MADSSATKHYNGSLVSELKSIISVLKNRRTVAFAYGFMFAFVAFTVFLAFNPSSNNSPFNFTNIFSSESFRSQSASLFSYFLPNNTQQVENSTGSVNSFDTVKNQTQFVSSDSVTVPSVLHANQSSSTENSVAYNGNSSNSSSVASEKDGTVNANHTPVEAPITLLKPNVSVVPENQIENSSSVAKSEGLSLSPGLQPKNQTVNSDSVPKKETSSLASVSSTSASTNQTANLASPAKGDGGVGEKKESNFTAAASLSEKKQSDNGTKGSSGSGKQIGIEEMVKRMVDCDLFDGEWVRDDSYPLYKPGACSFIDEQFNCILNGRPDKDYHKYKWKPKGCSIPRLNPAHMLNMLKGKRLVFVGDSLNRNMWESLVCMLKGAAKDKSKVYEAHGRSHFRGEAQYSFVFKDYGCTVEFFVSPFLVQEWEIHDKNKSRETLRLDLVTRSSDQYKSADYLVFNTGHWWTHEKTSKGKDYYQEGSHVYGELNVLEAFRKALTTWSRWVDSHVNPTKSLVIFRGYSASHFSGGQWNSGGACDHEVEPIKNDTYLTAYPSKMVVLENVLKGMKTPVRYMNITRMTDYRKDGHPSLYRKQNVPENERKSPMLFQDCSHWCLPGVPDIWNEVLYAELLINEYKKQQVQKRHR